MATSKTINSDACILDTNSATLVSNDYILKSYGGHQLSTSYSTLTTLYRMNEASWATIPGEIADAKGSNDATAMGNATTTEDDNWFGRVGTFSGNNTGIDCGSDSSFHTSNISVSIWVYPTAATNIYNDIINTGKYRLILRSTRKVEFWVYSTEVGWVQAVSNSTIPLNKWTHLAGTYDGTAKLYVNGNLQSTTGSGVVGITWAGNSIFIGQSGANSNEYTGKLDEAAFFSSALSSTDVKSISKQGNMIYSNSYILDTSSGTLNSNSYVLDTNLSTIDTDSYITKAYTKNKISLSYILDTDSSVINSDGWILLEGTITLNSNADILKASSKTISSNSQIFKGGYEGTLSSNSYILDTSSGTISSDGHISEEKEETLDSDGHLLKVTNKTLSSDTHITGIYSNNLLSDTYVLDITEESLASDAYVLTAGSGTLTSGSCVLAETEQTFVSTLFIKATSTALLNSDSHISKVKEATIISGAWIKKENAKTLTSDTSITSGYEKGFNSNAFIKRTETKTLNSNAEIQLGGLNFLDSDYFVIEVGAWSEEWEVEIFIPKEVTISQDAKIKQSYTATIDSNSYLLRGEEGGIVSNAHIKTDYTTLINSIYYIRRTDTTKPYVYEAEYINKPVIVSANSLSYNEAMI